MGDFGNGKDSMSTTIQVGEPLPDVRLFSGDSSYIQLEVVGGMMDGQRCRAAKSSFVIGREETNDLTLALDPTVSKRHARITREGDHYWLEDLDSSNGTYIGDERIRGRMLVGPGTIFIVGATSVEFTQV